MTQAAVSDAGPIIHLAEIDSLELLEVFDSLVIPETVYGELEGGDAPEGISDLPYELVEADEESDASETLDASEIRQREVDRLERIEELEQELNEVLEKNEQLQSELEAERTRRKELEEELAEDQSEDRSLFNWR